MAASFVLAFNTKDSERAFKRLRDRAPVAIMRALNRSIASAKTAMVREVATDIGLPVGRVRDRITVWEARLNRLSAQLNASPRRIPLAQFGVSGSEPSRGKKGGLYVRSRLKGGTPALVGAFIATMRSGHRGVFRRELGPAGRRRRSAGAWSKNLPMFELVGPSIVRVFEKHVQVGVDRAEEQMKKNLQSEFRFAMSQRA